MSTSKLLPGMVQWTLEQKNPDNVSCSFGCGYLFLDVCGFTRLTETASAKGHYGVEVITNLLNEYFDLLNSQIMRAGGQIIKFEGDAVLAAFPDSENACHITIKKCVEDIKQGLKKLNKRLESTYGSDLAFHSSMGFGISNIVILGKNKKHWDYFIYSPILASLYTQCDIAGKNECLETNVLIPANDQYSYNHNQIPQSSELSYDHLFFPPEVLQRISSESFSGELRNAAILFIGINAEILIRKSDYKTLNKYYSSVQDIVYRLGGMINKIDYTDKGLILLISFGILQTHIDDIERAIICANQINKLKSPLKAKIGLTYSNLYAGILGGQQRYEFGIIGNGVNVAARLMTSAKYGQIVFTKDILPSVQSRFEVQFLRKDKVKGIKGELEFYHIVRELPEYLNSYKKQYDDKTQVFYQNETESIIKKIASKKLSQLLISGEHGTGKSFISWKIISSFYAKASKIAIIVLDEFNRHDFLILHRKFISKSLGIDDPLAEPDKLKEYLYNLMDKRDSDILLQALGLQNQGSKQIIDSEKHKDLVLLSLYKSLYILMKDLDIVLLDNIQWLDDLSNQIIQKRLEEETIITPILIMTSTDDFKHNKSNRSAKTAYLKLDNLDYQSSFELIRSQLSNITHQAVDYILNTAGGNPRFIVELCAQIRSQFPNPAMLITESDIRDIQNRGLLPLSVENLFMIKYDSLSADAKDMLKKASIIGKGFTLDEIVETQKSINQNEIVPIINELQKKEIIDITELSPEVQYLFNNVLMRQAIYSTILLSEKVSLHNRVALFYEEKYAGWTSQHSELLAYHFHLGENKEKALHYSLLAAEQNYKISNYGEAIYYYQIALQNTDDSEQLNSIILAIIDSQLYLGEVDKAKMYLENIQVLEIRNADEISKYHFLRLRIYYLEGNYEEVLNYLSQINFYTGIYGDQIQLYQLDCLYKLFRIDEFSTLMKKLKQEYLKQAATLLKDKQQKTTLTSLLNIYKQIPDEKTTAEQRHYLYLLLKLEAIQANHFLNTGQYKEAVTSLKFQYNLAKALKDDLSMRIACGGLGIVYTRMGKLDEAHQAYIEAINIADKISDRFGYAKVLADMATLHRRMGNHKQALDNFQRSLKIFESLGNLVLQGFVLHGIGEVLIQEEKYDESLVYFRKALKIAKQCNDLFGISFEQDAIGDILFQNGKITEAKTLYHKNLKLQQKIGDTEGIAHTYGNLGNVARAENNLPLAMEYYNKNIAMTAEIGDLDGNGRGYYNLAGIYEIMKDKDKFVELLNKSIECFQKAGSVQYLELAKQRLQEFERGSEV